MELYPTALGCRHSPAPIHSPWFAGRILSRVAFTLRGIDISQTAAGTPTGALSTSRATPIIPLIRPIRMRMLCLEHTTHTRRAEPGRSRIFGDWLRNGTSRTLGKRREG